MIWFQLIATAACYFLFNRQFFRCSQSILKSKPLRWWGFVWTFLLNYGVFFFCSILNVHLILNWIIFLFLLFGEQLILYRKQTASQCFLVALLATQFGLAVNILFRSLTAVIFQVPLVFFNSVLDSSNMKAYPILFGFLVVGIVFFLITHFGVLKRLNLAMEDRKTLVFLICLLIAIYCYLCMNLMIYYIPENSLILKIWSMKSAVFVIMGEFLSVVLSVRMGQLAVYRVKSEESREQLAKERVRELELVAIATMDPLTGCENRAQAEKRLSDALNAGRMFCLCFVDLDGLKWVNDNLGHEMGDYYLQTVSKALVQVGGREYFLFRYGGDEFLLLLFDMAPSKATECLEQAQCRLQNQTAPFPMAISYGVAVPADGTDALSLIQAADARMYQMKLSKRP